MIRKGDLLEMIYMCVLIAEVWWLTVATVVYGKILLRGMMVLHVVHCSGTVIAHLWPRKHWGR